MDVKKNKVAAFAIKIGFWDINFYRIQKTPRHTKLK